MSKKTLVFVAMVVLMATSLSVAQENTYPPFIEEMLGRINNATLPSEAVAWGTACLNDSMDFRFIIFFFNVGNDVSYLQIKTDIKIASYATWLEYFMFEGNLKPIFKSGPAFPKDWRIAYTQEMEFFSWDTVTTLSSKIPAHLPEKSDSKEKKSYVSKKAFTELIEIFRANPDINEIVIQKKIALLW